MRSPRDFEFTKGMPLPRSVNCAPFCVPSGIVIRYLPFERRYLYIRSERGLGEGYRHLAVDIIAVALEYRVRTDADRDDEIAVRAAVPSAVALRADRDLLTVVYTRRNRDL